MKKIIIILLIVGLTFFSFAAAKVALNPKLAIDPNIENSTKTLQVSGGYLESIFALKEVGYVYLQEKLKDGSFNYIRTPINCFEIMNSSSTSAPVFLEGKEGQNCYEILSDEQLVENFFRSTHIQNLDEIEITGKFQPIEKFGELEKEATIYFQLVEIEDMKSLAQEQ